MGIVREENDEGAAQDDEKDLEEAMRTVDEILSFMDDPVALLERAVTLLKAKSTRLSLSVMSGVSFFACSPAVNRAIAAAYFASNGNDQWAKWLMWAFPGDVTALLGAVAIQVLP